MNLGAKCPRETLMVWQESLWFSPSYSETLMAEMNFFPSWDRIPPLPQEWVRALTPSFLWEVLLPHCMQLGVEAGALGIETERGFVRSFFSFSASRQDHPLLFSSSPAPQSSLLDPESLSWCLPSILAIARSSLLPLEAASIWRFCPTHSSTLISGPADVAELGSGLDGL